MDLLTAGYCMKINDYLSAHDVAHELLATKILLANAHATLSCWGGRLVTVDGYEGSISVDELARKILCAASFRCTADDLTIQERVTGMEITNKLRHFYAVTDEAIANANWFTRLINKIREFIPSTTRFDIDVKGSWLEIYFQGYSKAKFIQEFGGEKDKQGFYAASDGVIGSRILASESAMRAKLPH